MDSEKNARVVFKKHTKKDEVPSTDNFEYQECPYPAAPHRPDQVLIKNLYLSVDPTLRFCMNEGPIPNYLMQWKIGEPVLGVIGVGVVRASNSPRFDAGDIVTGYMMWPWQLYFIIEDQYLQKVDTQLTGERISLSLSCFGIAGLTSVLAIWEKGYIVPEEKPTFVVSTAAGSCGSLAGQIAKLEGCGTLVGICGSDDKCRFLHELGFDVAINYRKDNIGEKLKEACPKGVDRYFDNVGGEISEIVVEQMNPCGHIILCGQISQYQRGCPYPFPASESIQKIIQGKNITRDSYLVLNHKDRFEEGLQALAKWFKEGRLIIKEEFEEGLENAANAFLRMMNGHNTGKQLVHVADL